METLWITLPTNEENKLKEVHNLITNKNLTNLSVKQFIEKLEDNQAADWIEVLDQYNSISSINNMNTSEMLDRAKGVRNKFGQRRYPQLKDKEFEPRELLSLVILCYSNPNLIGPKLCRALNDNNERDIKKEMLENSARVGNRVGPFASNLRLLSTALYFNDTNIRLPVNVINRVKSETMQQERIVKIVDQRGGFEEVVNGPERSAGGAIRNIRSDKLDGTTINAFQILQSLQSDENDTENMNSESPELFSFSSALQSNHSGAQELPPEILFLNAATNSAASMHHLNGAMFVSGLLALSQIPVVAPVMRNIGNDLVTAGTYVGSFFSKNNSESSENEQNTTLLSLKAHS